MGGPKNKGYPFRHLCVYVKTLQQFETDGLKILCILIYLEVQKNSVLYNIYNDNIIQYNDFNTANPNILLIKVLRSHLQS